MAHSRSAVQTKIDLFNAESNGKVISNVQPYLKNRPPAENTNGVQQGSSAQPTAAESDFTETADIVLEHNRPQFVYDVDEAPGYVASLILALQVALNCFGGNLVCAVVIAKTLCLKHAAKQVEAELFRNMLFTAGLSTWLQVTFGARLPLYQGANSGWIAAVIAMTTTTPYFQCSSIIPNNTYDKLLTLDNSAAFAYNTDEREIEDIPENVYPYNHTTNAQEYELSMWLPRYRMLMGGLLGASLVQIFVGATGLISFLMNFIGPLTAAPVLIHVTLVLCPVALELSQKHWGLAFLTFSLVFIYSFFLGQFSIPWRVKTNQPNAESAATTKLVRYPIFSVSGLFLAMVTGWIVSGIMSPWLDDNSAARIDSKIGAVNAAPWFSVPLPMQYGWPTISASAFAVALIISVASIIESLGDYVAMAAVTHAHPMPNHAINRGILLEGIGCLLGSLVGAPAPVTTYSTVTGIVLVTRVASRYILQVAGLLTAVCAIFPKLGAILSSVPEPIVGGVGLATFGMIFSVGIGLLRNVDLDSARNLAVLGASIVLGVALPQWISVPINQQQLSFGHPSVDQCLHVLLGSSLFVGAMTGFILDNLLPGTRSERGLNGWVTKRGSSVADRQLARRLARLYSVPYIGAYLRHNRYVQMLPFMPNGVDVMLESDDRTQQDQEAREFVELTHSVA